MTEAASVGLACPCAAGWILCSHDDGPAAPAARMSQCGQRPIEGACGTPCFPGLASMESEGVWDLTLVPEEVPCDFSFRSWQQRERCPVFK